jgi:heme exporter protein C
VKGTVKTSLDRILLLASLAGPALLVWLALTQAPDFTGREGFTAPLSWKLFFFHVPIALVSFIAFGVALVASLAYLRTRSLTYDRAAHAGVEVGVLFTFVTLVTGMLWGQAEWGVAWRWGDLKLVLVLVLFLVYVAYLALRQSIPDAERRARIAAVYTCAGFAAVPLAWFAQRIWRSYHPTVFGTEAQDSGVVTPGVMPIFGLAFVVFIVVFLTLFRWRFRLRTIEDDVDELSTAEELSS